MPDDVGGSRATRGAGTTAPEVPPFHPFDLGIRILAAIGTSVGVLGFVTLVGGAIFYAQMSALGLPSDQIVSAIPQSTLLVVGARFILPVLAGVWLLLGVLGIFEKRPSRSATNSTPAHDPKTSDRRPKVTRWLAVTVLAAVELTFVVVDLGKTDASQWVYALLIGITVVLLIVTSFLGIREGPGFWRFAVVTSTAAAAFATALATTLASVAPAVRAVAIALIAGPPLGGIYAAANATDVLVGEVCADRPRSPRGSKRSGLVIVVPRSSIKTMLVTTNGSLSDALTREPALLAAVNGKDVAIQDGCTTSPLPEDLLNLPHQGVPGVLQGP